MSSGVFCYPLSLMLWHRHGFGVYFRAYSCKLVALLVLNNHFCRSCNDDTRCICMYMSEMPLLCI